jgi:hypothetical protein
LKSVREAESCTLDSELRYVHILDSSVDRFARPGVGEKWHYSPVPHLVIGLIGAISGALSNRGFSKSSGGNFHCWKLSVRVDVVGVPHPMQDQPKKSGQKYLKVNCEPKLVFAVHAADRTTLWYSVHATDSIELNAD